jgi:hypothetical protein
MPQNSPNPTSHVTVGGSGTNAIAFSVHEDDGSAGTNVNLNSLADSKPSQSAVQVTVSGVRFKSPA